MIGVVQRLPSDDGDGVILTLLGDVAFEGFITQNEVSQGDLVCFSFIPGSSKKICVEKINAGLIAFLNQANQALIQKLSLRSKLLITRAEVRTGPSFICRQEFIFQEPTDLNEAFKELSRIEYTAKALQLYFADGLILSGSFGELNVVSSPMVAEYSVGSEALPDLTVELATKVCRSFEE